MEDRRNGSGRAVAHILDKSQRQWIGDRRKGSGGGTGRAVGGSEVDQGHNNRIRDGTADTPQYLAVSGKGVPVLKRPCLSHGAVGKRFQSANTILVKHF